MEHASPRTLKFSVLDLVPVLVGHSIQSCIRNTLELARAAEGMGYHRFWITEHHNSAAFASSATTPLIAHVAAGTKKIRVGAAGMMLPNHAAIEIAEHFGTLQALYPARIDLGVGSAPGTDPVAAALFRRAHQPASFADNLDELIHFFSPADPTQTVRAVPGEDTNIPIWILGRSKESAVFAAERGLPFAFAGHLLAHGAAEALAAYRTAFRPSANNAQPYTALSLNLVAADTLEKASWLKTSLLHRALDMVRGCPKPLRQPMDNADLDWTADEKDKVINKLGILIEGDHEKVREKIFTLVDECQPDELIVSTEIHDFVARAHSLRVLVEAVRG